jgi:molecular chaperone GrpE (heat shock protein)
MSGAIRANPKLGKPSPLRHHCPMTELTRPTVPKWPFFLGDGCMLALAWFIHWESRLPLSAFTIGAIIVCVALGAFLAIIPFLLEYRISLRLLETEALTDVVTQVKNLDDIAAQIKFATGQWQTVQDHSAKTVAAATTIGEKMTAEARAFAESMQKANDAEKANLRLEVDKLRRAEAEWLQVIVRMLDHTYALYSAAVRSGKSSLKEQLAQFQSAQRDAARRVGLAVFLAEPGEAFDAAKHQTSNKEAPPEGATIEGTLATGYTFRGQQIRPALVSFESAASLKEAVATSPSEAEPQESSAPQEQTLF